MIVSEVSHLHRTLDQELQALARGASMACLVCGEFVLEKGDALACPECGSVLRGGLEAAGTQLELGSQAG